jgi:hypothetical protein
MESGISCEFADFERRYILLDTIGETSSASSGGGIDETTRNSHYFSRPLYANPYSNPKSPWNTRVYVIPPPQVEHKPIFNARFSES